MQKNQALPLKLFQLYQRSKALTPKLNWRWMAHTNERMQLWLLFSPILGFEGKIQNNQEVIRYCTKKTTNVSLTRIISMRSKAVLGLGDRKFLMTESLDVHSSWTVRTLRRVCIFAQDGSWRCLRRPVVRKPCYSIALMIEIS